MRLSIRPRVSNAIHSCPPVNQLKACSELWRNKTRKTARKTDLSVGPCRIRRAESTVGRVPWGLAFLGLVFAGAPQTTESICFPERTKGSEALLSNCIGSLILRPDLCRLT